MNGGKKGDRARGVEEKDGLVEKKKIQILGN